MSYISGAGSLQQGVNPAAPSEIKPTVQALVPNGDASGAIANVEHGDQTDLSSAGGLVAQALESSDVRTTKITALQQAISAGDYSVSSSDVADKIIQSLLD
jgi:negative regulator of flagellin synthesis FlgM